MTQADLWAKSKTLSPKQAEQKGLDAWLKW
jgi:hypothetical protein